MRVEVAVIGAGASGMVASILLARAGRKVLLIERQDRGGKKILASGNGRCNIANIKISKDNFYGSNRALIDSLLKEYSLKDIVDFFKSIGLEIKESEDGRLFPLSMQSSIVLELLNAEIERLNIKRAFSVKELKIDSNFNIFFKNYIYKAKSIIIATGSPAAEQLGGNSSGLNIAKSFGHTILKPLPALVPLYSKAPICKEAQGVKLVVKLSLIAENKEITSKSGDLLFTKYGLSGLSVLDISIEVARAIRANKICYILIDFFPQFSKKELFSFLKKRVNKERNLKLINWLNGIINIKIAQTILKDLKLDKRGEKELNSSILKALVELLKEYRVKIDKLREFKYAEVAIGGVDSKELDLTLQSKKRKGLYFIGEVVDFVGDRGGYNFIFAWYSAMRVGKELIDNG